MNKRADRPASSAVAEYKQILRTVLDNRPSGTRLRLAQALDKNRSFISQITNPAYLTPIPPRHLPTIFQICHFSPTERTAFEAAFRLAHSRHFSLVEGERPKRNVEVIVPDFGNDSKNREFDFILQQLVKTLGQFAQETKS